MNNNRLSNDTVNDGERRGSNCTSGKLSSHVIDTKQSCPSNLLDNRENKSNNRQTLEKLNITTHNQKSIDQINEHLPHVEQRDIFTVRSTKSLKHQSQQQKNKPSLDSSTLQSSDCSTSTGPRAKKALASALAWIMGDTLKVPPVIDRRQRSVTQSSDDERKRLVINISGKRFETYESTVKKSPNCLLASPQREYFYDPLKKEYFFDRNRKCFASILTYCQSGLLIKPTSIDERIFCAELRFFGFDDEADAHSPPTSPGEMDRVLPKNKYQRHAWELFEYPDTSLGARIVALFSVTIIILSIVMFCVETLPEFKIRVPVYNGTNGTSPIDYVQKVNPKHEKVLYLIECVCIAWFTLEYLVRFLSSPQKVKFLYQLLNIIDVVAILPFYITLILSSTNSNVSSLSILRVLRLVRVFRIFKLSRYSKGLKILGYTFRASLQELGLLAFFLVIGIVLFASAAYYCEEGVIDTKFESIPHSFWWAIVTMTTVGYGDMYPETLGGKLVGSFCVLIGVLAIAFPVPVIVNNFTYYYTLEQVAPEPLDMDYVCSPLSRNRIAHSSWSESMEMNTPPYNKKHSKNNKRGIEEIEPMFKPSDKSNGHTEVNGNDVLSIESNV